MSLRAVGFAEELDGASVIRVLDSIDRNEEGRVQKNAIETLKRRRRASPCSDRRPLFGLAAVAFRARPNAGGSAARHWPGSKPGEARRGARPVPPGASPPPLAPDSLRGTRQAREAGDVPPPSRGDPTNPFSCSSCAPIAQLAGRLCNWHSVPSSCPAR